MRFARLDYSLWVGEWSNCSFAFAGVELAEVSRATRVVIVEVSLLVCLVQLETVGIERLAGVHHRRRLWQSSPH